MKLNNKSLCKHIFTALSLGGIAAVQAASVDNVDTNIGTPQSGASDLNKNVRALNGEPAKREDFPYLGMMSVYMGGYFSSCQISLISNQTAVTAARCLLNQKRELIKNMDHISIYIFGGASSYDSIALTRARAVHYHPKYSYQSLENDIAIVELNSPVSKDIATPVAIYSGDVMDDMNLVAAGWDLTSSEPLRRSYYELTRVTRTPSSSNVCKKLHPSWSNNNKDVVCTHVNDTKDMSYSSDGGPLTYINNGVNLLVGVGDSAFGNFNGEYGSEGIKARYHTHVYSYIDWIVKTTGLEKSYLLNTTARPSPNYSTVTNIETYGNNESMISASTILQNTGFILVVFLSLVFSLLF